MPVRYAIEFDVSDAVDLHEPVRIAGTMFLPDGEAVAGGIVLLVPGGGFTLRYYDLQVEGHHGYSAAMQLAGRGLVAVAIDNLGTGKSTIPKDGHEVTLDRSARALAEVARQLRYRARHGRLHASLRAGEAFVAGIGHSLGGCIMTLAQGHYRACDALAVLGYSCRYIVGAVDPETGQRLREREYTGNGYNRTTPSVQRERFYSSEVPIAVIEAEEADRVPMPNGVAEALVPGRTAKAAGMIDVPVLLAFGMPDVSPDPYAEPAFYSRSPDVTLLMLADARHAHNSAPGRVALWNRIIGWIDALRPAEAG